MKKLRLSSITSLLNQIIVVISGLILPRYILSYFGSETYGLTTSITQFLLIISFLELGIGAVVKSALYKPLSENNTYAISIILKSAEKYFKRIAIILVVYVIFLMLFLPNSIENNIGLFSTAFLIFTMSISIFARYYFGIVNSLLVTADQKSYISFTVQLITVIINTIISVLLIQLGMSIHVVQLFTGFIFLLRPLYLNYYVRKNYKIDYNVKLTYEPLKQKWNGVANHVAFVITSSTDIVVLTLFSTLKDVAIYSVYNMVVNGVKLLIASGSTGIQAFFGNLLAKNEMKSLNSYFTLIEWLFHTVIVFMFTLTIVLINPFIKLYTTGINDANYYQPIFAILLILGQAFFCLRLPYNEIILAAGHYRQTQSSAIIEVIINVVVSLFTVSRFGLIGVATGTLLAMLYRTIYFVIYLSRNIINRPIKFFLKHIIIDFVIFILMITSSTLFNINPENYYEWILVALKLGTIFFIISLCINLIFYKNNTNFYIKKVFKLKK